MSRRSRWPEVALLVVAVALLGWWQHARLAPDSGLTPERKRELLSRWDKEWPEVQQAFEENDLDQAEVHLRHAMKTAELLGPGEEPLHETFDEFGRLYAMRGEPARAAEYQSKAVAACKQCRGARDLTVALYLERLASVSPRERALECLDEATDIVVTAGSSPERTQQLDALIRTYQGMGGSPNLDRLKQARDHPL